MEKLLADVLRMNEGEGFVEDREETSDELLEFDDNEDEEEDDPKESDVGPKEEREEDKE